MVNLGNKAIALIIAAALQMQWSGVNKLYI
jgi:hypothetical protein